MKSYFSSFVFSKIYPILWVFFISGIKTITLGNTWSINAPDFSNNMSMTVHVSIDGSNQSSGSIAAFSGSEIRGLEATSSTAPFGDYAGQSIYSLMVHGDSSGDILSFKWSPDGTETNAIPINTSDGSAIDFTVNDNMGTVTNPILFVGTTGNYQSGGSGYQSGSSGYQSDSSGSQSSGIIDSNTTWTKANSPYLITDNVLVGEGITLTVEPGVVVKFAPSTYLKVEGQIKAEGSESEQIIFESNSNNPILLLGKHSFIISFLFKFTS